MAKIETESDVRSKESLATRTAQAGEVTGPERDGAAPSSQDETRPPASAPASKVTW